MASSCTGLGCGLIGSGYCGGAGAAPPAVAIGTAKPMPTKKAWSAGLASAGDDADDLARRVEQRAAGVAGVDRRVELDEARRASPPSRRRTVRSSAETTPAVTSCGQAERVARRR